MAVVIASEFALKRAHRELKKAHGDADWQSVQKWDGELVDLLSKAFSDEHRDTKKLISEMANILNTYGNLVISLSEHPRSEWQRPD